MIKGKGESCRYCGELAVKLRNGFCSTACEKAFEAEARSREQPFFFNGVPYPSEAAYNAARDDELRTGIPAHPLSC